MAATHGVGLETRLVDRCIQAAVRCAGSVEAWRRQRRTLERLPSPLADTLLGRLAAGRLLFPSLLEVFQYSVEEIDLSGYATVDAEWLAYLGSFRYLRKLKLADCKNINNPAVWPLAGMSTLRELDLSRCSKITDAGIRHIISIENLEKLHLSEIGLTDSGVMLLSSLKNLSLLDLGGSHMTDKALRSLQVLTSLQHLDIWGSEITNNGASVLKTFTRLSFLNIAWTHVTHLPVLPMMQCLNMSECTIQSVSDEDSAVLVPLEKLVVSAAAFGNIDEIFARIQASSLSFLDMSRCSANDLSFLDKMKNLQHLDLSFTGVTDDAIQHLATIGMNLKYLSLKNTRITSQALCILAGTVADLTSLSLAHTKIDDSALIYISMMPSLRMIDLSQTTIKGHTLIGPNSERILSLCVLQNLDCLESLNLEDIPLAAEIIPPLASFRALKYLYLKSDFLSDAALHALSSAINLIHLGFCGNILSDRGLLQFVPPATLSVLDLSGCWILTGDAILAFCRDHPKIEVRHELIQELQADRFGTNQLHKPKQIQQLKAKAVISLPGPSRLPEVSFVDERIKYSREELMELRHPVTSGLAMQDLQLPLELQRIE